MKTSVPTRGHADAVAQAHLPLAIWALSVVSLLMDISSELIHSLLPVFLVSSLGASVFTVGWIEGAGESLALIIKVFSGSLSDWLGQRKGLAVVARVWAPCRNRSSPWRPVRSGSVCTSAGSSRQGSPRRRPRYLGGRPGAARDTRGGLWPAPSARYRRRLHRLAAGDRIDGWCYILVDSVNSKL